MSYLLGLDIGSSSIKACLFDPDSGRAVAQTQSPHTELEIQAPRPGWAEQHPEVWWEHTCKCLQSLAASSGSALSQVSAIGISYQMHGLVTLDEHNKPVRPAIIWCDSRAVETGAKLFEQIGKETCLEHLLNSPGNFTLSKLAWVKENESDLFKKIKKICLPGDYIAYRLTGRLCTTASGLSEGVLWDFRDQGIAKLLLNAAGIEESVLPEIQPTFSDQGTLLPAIATEFGLSPDAVVSYRAGDQPNNAFSLGVLSPGEVAATAGTSGVIYAVGDRPSFDPQMAVNTFLHVNNQAAQQRYGTLLCLNGCGILYSWLRRLTSFAVTPDALSYEKLNALARSVPAGAEGLQIFPFGNGAERSLGNRQLGASFEHIDLNRHSLAHVVKASQEGIAFALRYGLEVIERMYGKVTVTRAGRANLFLSEDFRTTFATITNSAVQLFATDGAQGAARGAGVGSKRFATPEQAVENLQRLEICDPSTPEVERYQELYQRWKSTLVSKLAQA